jgi:hypothetical protein
VFIEGWIFIIISLTGVRGRLVSLVPKSIMLATAGAAGNRRVSVRGTTTAASTAAASTQPMRPADNSSQHLQLTDLGALFNQQCCQASQLWIHMLGPRQAAVGCPSPLNQPCGSLETAADKPVTHRLNSRVLLLCAFYTHLQVALGCSLRSLACRTARASA